MLMLSLLYLFYYYYLLNLLFFTNIYFWHIGQLWQPPTMATANNGNMPTMATSCQLWQRVFSNSGNALPTMATGFCQQWQQTKSL